LENPKQTYTLEILRPVREALCEDQIVNDRKLQVNSRAWRDVPATCPDIFERNSHPIHCRDRPRNEHVDMFIVFQRVRPRQFHRGNRNA
jgi:hypothetical protein